MLYTSLYCSQSVAQYRIKLLYTAVTGILGSNPDADGRFRFKPMNGLMETNSLAVNVLTREHSRRCEGR